MGRRVGAVLVAGAVGCAPAPVNLAPLPPPGPTCPLDGCSGTQAASAGGGANTPSCSDAETQSCGGASGEQCRQRALDNWSERRDGLAAPCIARMLSEACALKDAMACGLAGRLWLEGRGVARDIRKGIAMLVVACDEGIVIACSSGARWLADSSRARDVEEAADLRKRLDVEGACAQADADACFQVGRAFHVGQDGFPQDWGRAATAYERGCNLGDARACNNLGDALDYGDGLPRDAQRAAALFDKACHLGNALGCANLGTMAEHGEGVVRDAARARDLYRDACLTGEVYGCLHADMMVAGGGAVAVDPERVLERWRSACEKGRDARACAFVGILYEDGHDGRARDEAASMRAMTRACDLGERRACEWVKASSDD
ncbi:MAG: tetratricopeptide repeat protein [Polyangiaceae bacterium]|jgi:TPR repeat protein